MGALGSSELRDENKCTYDYICIMFSNAFQLFGDIILSQSLKKIKKNLPF